MTTTTWQPVSAARMNMTQTCASCQRRVTLWQVFSGALSSCNQRNSSRRCIVSRLLRLTTKHDREEWLRQNS